MRSLVLLLLLAGCSKPVYKVEIFRGEQQVCSQTTLAGKTVAYRCVPVESLGINRDELG